MMRTLLAGCVRIYARAAPPALLILLLFAGFLMATGTVPGERVRAAARALGGAAPLPAPGPASPGARDWEELEDARRRMEEDLIRRRAELERIGEMAAVRLGQIEAQRREAVARQKDADRAVARLRTLEAERAAAQSDREVDANAPILSRMEVPSVLAATRDWDDARIVRTLRAMRPSKAAEILEAMRRDTDFAGRIGPLMDEFKKAP